MKQSIIESAEFWNWMGLARIVRHARPMPWRRLTLVILTYVSLDLSNPFHPGAFNFDPDDCVDGIRQASGYSTFRVDRPATSTPSPVPISRTAEEPRLISRPAMATQTAGDWLADLKRAHLPSHEISSLSEDH
jgi:hypothetical protein